jgi:hypothetical protein
MAWTLWRSREPREADTAARGAAKRPARQAGPVKPVVEVPVLGDGLAMDMDSLKDAMESAVFPPETAGLLKLLVLTLVEGALMNMANDRLSAQLLEELPNSKLPLGSVWNPVTREGKGRVIIDPLLNGDVQVMDFAKLKEAMGLRMSEDATSVLKVLVLMLVDEAFNVLAKDAAANPEQRS